MTKNFGARLGRQASRLLAGYGKCAMAEGLTDTELTRVETEFDFQFSDDHRAFLKAGLPLDPPGGLGSWPNWRYGDPEDLSARLAWPVNGVLFDVEHGTFWHEPWGPRPADAKEAVVQARRHLAQVPVMVPVYSHRYLPAGKGTWGHPVLSMYQTDIIVYGADLPAYMENEFGREPHQSQPDAPVTVDFWRELTS